LTAELKPEFVLELTHGGKVLPHARATSQPRREQQYRGVLQNDTATVSAYSHDFSRCD
jgi:hypothetical protein